ncbi:hypothetical protein B0H14DRAFT_2558802 [Mycena olivaceomarginata]|nr:hypothetical protein B0H14DRAFT_2558802 [Mycena olivaceomarginata]
MSPPVSCRAHPLLSHCPNHLVSCDPQPYLLSVAINSRPRIFESGARPRNGHPMVVSVHAWERSPLFSTTRHLASSLLDGLDFTHKHAFYVVNVGGTTAEFALHCKALIDEKPLSALLKVYNTYPKELKGKQRPAIDEIQKRIQEILK